MQTANHQTLLFKNTEAFSAISHQTGSAPRTIFYYSYSTAVSNMPHLPFSTTTSPSSSPTSSASSSPTPSIVLHPATGIIDRSDCGFPSNLQAGPSSKRALYKSSDEMASAYRTRYAQYLASTFNISLQAALAEADSQLQQTPRRSSSVSEAEVLREG